MPTFPRLTAVEFGRELESGTTRPCVFLCEDEADQVGEFVVKLRQDVRGSGLAFELVAARLAGHFEIPLPEPALVELPQELASAQANNPRVRDRLARSAGLNFGTRYLVGLTTWDRARRITEQLKPIATAILAFDALIDNPDRRVEKPNLLTGADTMWVIDHELAFAFLRLVGMPTPWRDRLGFLRTHPLFGGLRGRTLDLSPFGDRLSLLTDDAIAAVCAEVPAEFGREHLPAISAYLRAVREDAAGFLAGIVEVAQ